MNDSTKTQSHQPEISTSASAQTESPFSHEVVLQRSGQVSKPVQLLYAENLHFDLYHCQNHTELAPCVVLVCGFNDAGFTKIFGSSWKDTRAVQSWAQLLAASGFSAVTLQANDPIADTCSLLEHIRENSQQLSIDPERIALWSCSGNVPTALGVLQRSPFIAATSLLYGFMLEPAENRFVSEAAAQFRFANPELSEQILEHRARQLIVRAGKDEFPGVNASIDYFVALALEKSAPVTLCEYAAGIHAFDLHDDSAASKAVLEQVLDFLSTALKPERL